MKSVFLTTTLVLLSKIALSQYKMGPYITCLEQNDETPFGFKESDTYANAAWCNVTDSDMIAETGYDREYWCDIYAQPIPESRFAGRGDVCDHTDPITGIIRNTCKGAFMFGAKVDDEKTWSWKCAEISGASCPIKSTYGVGMLGCLINRKRIQCCCQEDFCQGNPVMIQYAAFARADHWNNITNCVNFTEILAIDPGDMCVVVDPELPGADTYQYGGNCDYSIGGPEIESETLLEQETETEQETIIVQETETEIGTETEQETIIAQETETETETGIGTYDVENDNNEDQVTTEECLIKEAIPNTCDCGAFCSGTEYEYRATVEKCGTQVITTGEYGAMSCVPDIDIMNKGKVYETGDMVNCKVLDCVNGEFAILDVGNRMYNVYWMWKIVIGFMIGNIMGFW